MTSFEGGKNVALSFLIELVGTFILLLVIYSNAIPGNAYRRTLQIGQTAYTLGPIITGIVLMCLVYTAAAIAVNTNIGAGHMFPLITIPAMMGKLGILNVSPAKGAVLLCAQFLAMIIATLVV